MTDDDRSWDMFRSNEEIVTICRTDVEALHNLLFLIKKYRNDPEPLAGLLEMAEARLKHLTQVICPHDPS